MTKPAAAKEADPISMARVVLHSAAQPGDRVHVPLRAEQAIAGRTRVGRDAHRDEHAVGEEHEPAAGPQQAGGLGEPPRWIAPGAGAVLADDEIEAAAPQRQLLPVRLHERKRDAVVELAAAGGGELRRAEVDRDGAGTCPDESGRQVGAAAADLDDVQPGDVPEEVEVILAVLEQSPPDPR